MLSSNGLEVSATPDTLTWRMIGARSERRPPPQTASSPHTLNLARLCNACFDLYICTQLHTS